MRRIFVVFLILACVRSLSATKPRIDRYPGYQNIPRPLTLLWPPPPPYNHTVIRIKDASSASACETACLGYVAPDTVSPVSGWSRCQSYTWMDENCSCTLVVDESEWDPVPANGSTCGRVSWPPRSCRTDADCSYNGRCVSSTNLCACRPAWKGDRCQTLSLLPTTRSSGLRQIDTSGRNVSSWGGSVLLDDDGVTLHMWAAEMLHYCGIDSWTTNSQIVHATCHNVSSTNHYGARCAFERREVVWPAFAHEPNVVRGPRGEWVMYFTAAENMSAPPATPCVRCEDGRTSPACHGSAAGDGPTYMSWSMSPYGPWSPPKKLFESQRDETNMDTNLAVVILSNGSVVGIARTGGDPTGIVAHYVRATRWSDPSSYVGEWDRMLFPDTHVLNAAGVEDPFVYLDENGVFHAVFHNQIQSDDERLCGGHAFSTDGLATSWTFTGTAWSSVVSFDRNASYAFSRRERPHLVFGDATSPFKITALTTGVQYGEGSPMAVDGEDACYTSIQPVAL